MVDNMKGKIMIRLFTLLFVMISMSANAADVTIDMLNKDGSGRKMVYSKEVAQVAVGDTITWLPASKGHNVHFISAPDGVKKLPKSKFNKEFSYTFEKEGIYLYQCTPHKGMGMIALVVVGDNLDNLANIKKAKVLGKSKKKLKELLSQL
tara:strand:+ start:779 stop:1228 length:450 start_codon:yes stop_codon:yes gene_type:complete